MAIETCPAADVRQLKRFERGARQDHPSWTLIRALHAQVLADHWFLAAYSD